MSRNYSNTAAETTLAAAVSAADTTITVSATSGFPAAPYILALDAEQANQELVLVTGVSSTTLTVTRGYDSTVASDHATGAVVRHSHAAIDFRDSRTHEQAGSGVHGLSGTVVGTTDTQALTNKDLSSGTNTFPTSLVTATSTHTLENKTLFTPEVDSIFNLSGMRVLNIGGNVDAKSTLTVDPGDTDDDSLTLRAGGSVSADIDINLVPYGLGLVKVGGAEVLTARTAAGFDAACTDDDFVFQSDHGAWTTYTPTWGATSSAPVLGNGTIEGRYRQVGKDVHFIINLTMGSTTTYGSGVFTFTLPAAAQGDCAIGSSRSYDSSSFTNYGGSAYIDSTDLTTCRALHATGSMASGQPFTWASGDTLMISGTYEAA